TEFFRINGWRWTELFPFAQMAWHRRYSPEAYGRAARFCMNSDYLLFRLTGRWGMDPSTATTFYFQNQLEMKWHKPHLQIMGIGEDQVSEIRPSGSVLGPLSREGAQNTGLDRSTLVVLGAFDHPCAARGTGCLDVGDLLLSCGTSWVSFYPTENRELALSEVMLIDPFLRPSGPWGVMAALTAIAVNIDWWVDNVINRERKNGKARYELLDEGAVRAAPGAGGLYINPFEEIRSYSEPVKKITTSFSKDQISRALMEGAVFEMRRKIVQLAEAGLRANRITMVGGPTNSPVWPRMVAEITGLDMRLLNGQTAGALGAAVLAAIGAGLFKNEREAFGAMGGTAEILKPDPVEVDRYIGVYAEYLKAYPQSKKPVK
ncbi:MAG TPA: FGGY-family carbohydrate kinase, partial [Spirochaetia bacterium]|nr:FGGY-family carbohydrate kinase [Spirochaetia bacterium]